MDDRPGGLCVSWRNSAAPAAGGLILWLAFVGALVRQPALLDLVWFAGPFSLALAYVLVAALVNRTSLEVGTQGVRVSHGPLWLPWEGARTFAADALTQLASRRYGRGRGWAYELCAVAEDRTATSVVSGLSSPHQALFLEQLVERRLEIVDRLVVGELPR